MKSSVKKSLLSVWKSRLSLYDEGSRLWAEGSKLWAEAILEFVGNVAIEWTADGCKVAGELFKNDAMEPSAQSRLAASRAGAFDASPIRISSLAAQAAGR